MLGDLISQDMFGYRENERKWRKVENYIKRRNLESSTIRNVSKVFKWVNQVLFIGQGQVDTWHHLRGFSEASSSRNLEKIHFRMNPSNFAQWCEVEDPLALFSSSWSVSHDCAKISHGHAKLLFTFPLVCCSQHPLCFILHGHAKLKNMLFRLFFAISPISSFLIHLYHLQFNSKSQSKPIALLLSLCIWIILYFICFLQFDSSLLSQIYQNHTLKWLQNFIKLVSNSCKGNNMLIECFRHNYYLKDVNLIRIIV